MEGKEQDNLTALGDLQMAVFGPGIKNLANDNNNQLDPYLVEPKEAGRLLGISRSQFLALDKCGRLGPQAVNLGYGAKRQCRRWNTGELRDWANSGCPSRQEWVGREEIN